MEAHEILFVLMERLVEIARRPLGQREVRYVAHSISFEMTALQHEGSSFYVGVRRISGSDRSELLLWPGEPAHGQEILQLLADAGDVRVDMVGAMKAGDPAFAVAAAILGRLAMLRRQEAAAFRT